MWLPFDLHPEYPPDGIPRERLLARYGAAMDGYLRRLFEAAGLRYNPHPERVPNSRAALRVTELARDRGLHRRIHDALMDAYWAEACDIGDPDVVGRVAVAAGLDADEVAEVLDGDAYLDRVEASTAQAHAIGVDGIRGWLLDRRILVLGAQPRQAFEEAFARLTDGESRTD